MSDNKHEEKDKIISLRKKDNRPDEDITEELKGSQDSEGNLIGFVKGLASQEGEAKFQKLFNSLIPLERESIRLLEKSSRYRLRIFIFASVLILSFSFLLSPNFASDPTVKIIGMILCFIVFLYSAKKVGTNIKEHDKANAEYSNYKNVLDNVVQKLIIEDHKIPPSVIK